jgi:hypothetical protein
MPNDSTRISATGGGVSTPKVVFTPGVILRCAVSPVKSSMLALQQPRVDALVRKDTYLLVGCLWPGPRICILSRCRLMMPFVPQLVIS